ncbi:FecR family protein [Halomonas chromatireducens]|uniref:FecR protein n=1 Tax=Halomonas chromatireducens TaxID=507626 RepID=A0A0X8HE88_9GAMM|nr:hypothetical protein [Halomonas chromatireducens]AMD01038.1 hypothetical protein LOKO_01971 [Halomonas chromatireducens]
MSLFAKPPLSYFLSLSVGGFALLPVFVHADTPAGHVMFVHGDATIERDGERIPAERGADFFAGDTFHTADASTLQLRYSDGGTKAIRPGSTYTLERYELDDDSPEESAQGGELVRGGLRAITGAIGRNAPDNVTNSTPVATMGIRGTSFQMLHIPEEGSPSLPGVKAGSYLYVESGLLVMSTDAGETLVRPGQVFFSPERGEPPRLVPGGVSIFEQLEESMPQGREEDDTAPPTEASQGSTTPTDPDAPTDTATTQGTFFDELALTPLDTADLQATLSESETSEQLIEIERDAEELVEADSEPWLDFEPTTDNTLTTNFALIDSFYESNTPPTDQGSTNIGTGEVVWGYWESGQEVTLDGSTDVMPESVVFIAASPNLSINQEYPLAIDDMVSITFSWVGGTGLVPTEGGDVIPILSDSSITLSNMEGIEIEILLDDFGALIGVGESFNLTAIPLEHANCEASGCFDDGNFTGRYIGEDAAAIMSLIEAWGDELGNYSGTGLFLFDRVEELNGDNPIEEIPQ